MHQLVISQMPKLTFWGVWRVVVEMYIIMQMFYLPTHLRTCDESITGSGVMLFENVCFNSEIVFLIYENSVTEYLCCFE